jgi:O-antigen/teichoic acid export membrane protein
MEGKAERVLKQSKSVESRTTVQPKSLVAQFLPWLAKGGFTLVDQGLISGSNFLISILLARWLVPEEYGAYAVAFAIFILLTVFYQSLLLEPMAVFGGSAYRDNLREYLRVLLRLHLVASVVMCLPVVIWAVATGGIHPRTLSAALLGVAMASPCVLVFWLVRRIFYLELSPAYAAHGALWYFAFVTGGLFLANYRHVLSPFTAFLVMTLAALVTCVFLLRHLLSNLQPGTTALHVWEVFQRHWVYGRWALVANFASWVPAYIYYPLLGRFSGIAHSGELRALMNFVAPQLQIQAALSMLFLPYAARLRGSKGASYAMALNRKLTLVSLAGATAYWLVIIFFKGTVFHLLYRGNYMDVAYLLPWVAVGSILWAGAFGPTVVLRAMEAPRLVFLAYLVATVLSLAVGIPATHFYGLRGAIIGVNVSDAASWAMVAILLRRKTNDARIEFALSNDRKEEELVTS